MIPAWWPAAGQAAKLHAQRTYPHESCGVVVRGEYQPLMNDHTDPAQDFDCTAQLLDILTDGEDVQALVHSHPNGCDHPTETDVRQQLAWRFPWGLVPFIGDKAQDPFLWGDGVAEDVPMLGRPFRWGPTGTDGKGDCAALIRDYYRQRFGIRLMEFPRDEYWIKSGLRYAEALQATGLQPIDGASDPQDGDVILFRLRSSGGTHAGMYVHPGMVLHHLQGRFSCEEPLITFRQHIMGWFRHATRIAHAPDPARPVAGGVRP